MTQLQLNEQTRQQILARQKPYGLNLVPNSSLVDLSKPLNEEAIKRRWYPVLDRLGIQVIEVILGVLSAPQRVSLDGIDWLFSAVDNVSIYEVPDSVLTNVREAEAAEVPFAQFILAKELPPQPRIQPVRRQETTRKHDPIFYGVIPTVLNRGIWCCLGRWDDPK